VFARKSVLLWLSEHSERFRRPVFIGEHAYAQCSLPATLTTWQTAFRLKTGRHAINPKFLRYDTFRVERRQQDGLTFVGEYTVDSREAEVIYTVFFGTMSSVRSVLLARAVRCHLWASAH
jgi:hypothetical protein